DRRRNHLGIFADRQERERDQARDEDDDRQHAREDRAIDKEACETHDCDSVRWAWAVAGGAPIWMSWGATGMPGMNTFCTPWTMILSPADRPEVTTRRPPFSRPRVTSRRMARFCSSRTNTYLRS